MNEILTPCILQTIIICCTIIIIGIIAVSAYRINQQQQRSWASYIFSASILLILAIAIFSYCFCKDRNVLDFISLASALISIILAVVTIIYSYFTNSRSNSQIDRLNKAAEDVSKATISYESSAESLKENIQKILNEIGGIKNQMTHNGVDTDYEATLERKVKNDFIDSIFTDFNKNNSNAGFIFIYLCSKIKETGKKCNLNDIFTEDTIMYYIGYAIALNSVGFTVINIDFNTKTITKVELVDDIVKGALKRFEIESNNQFVIEQRQIIDQYFAISKPSSKSTSKSKSRSKSRSK